MLNSAGNYRRTAGKARSIQSIALLETQPCDSGLKSELFSVRPSVHLYTPPAALHSLKRNL